MTILTLFDPNIYFFSSLGERYVPYENFSSVDLIGREGQEKVYEGVFGKKKYCSEKVLNKRKNRKLLSASSGSS